MQFAISSSSFALSNAALNKRALILHYFIETCEVALAIWNFQSIDTAYKLAENTGSDFPRPLFLKKIQKKILELQCKQMKKVKKPHLL